MRRDGFESPNTVTGRNGSVLRQRFQHRQRPIRRIGQNNKRNRLTVHVKNEYSRWRQDLGLWGRLVTCGRLAIGLLLNQGYPSDVVVLIG